MADTDEKTERKLSDLLAPEHPSRVLAEKTASKFSYENLVMKRYLEQNFKINEHITLRMRSISAGAAEFIFRTMSHRFRDEWGAIFDENVRMAYLAASLQEINQNLIGDDMDAALMAGDEAKARGILDARILAVKAQPSALTSLMYQHYALFSERVEDFIQGGTEEVGNS